MTVDLCMVYAYICAHARFDDLELDLDFENVCNACSCFFLSLFVVQALVELEVFHPILIESPEIIVMVCWT